MDEQYGRSNPLRDLERNNTSSGESIYFPNDLTNIDHYVMFRAFKFNKLTSLGGTNERASKQTSLSSIALPMPNILNTGYEARYREHDMNVTGMAVEAGVSTVINNFNKNAPAQNDRIDMGGRDSKTSSFIDKVTAAFKQTIKDSEGATNLKPADVVAGVAAVVGAPTTAQGALGIAKNPFNALLYEGPDRRSHRFSYRLSARNRKESESIRKIILNFKWYMSGSYGFGKAQSLAQESVGVTDIALLKRGFFEYPEYFDIEFHHSKYLFDIGPSVLKSFSVNYHPENYPAYVRDKEDPTTPAPLEVSIDMTFQERDIVTKEEIWGSNR